jgi:hypothetical protein
MDAPKGEYTILQAFLNSGVTPNLDLLLRTYIRQFDLKHTFRFFKETLA